MITFQAVIAPSKGPSPVGKTKRKVCFSPVWARHHWAALSTAFPRVGASKCFSTTSSPLARSDRLAGPRPGKAIPDEEHDDGANNGADESGALVGPVPADRLAHEGRNEG